MNVHDYLQLYAENVAHETLSVAQGVAVAWVDCSGPVMRTDPHSIQESDFAFFRSSFSTLPCIVIAHGGSPVDPRVQDLADVILEPSGIDIYSESLREAISANPLAGVALAIHLRSSENRSIDEGLVVESTLYSLLQSGPEFQRWLGSRASSVLIENADGPIRTQRIGSELRVTLNRPHRHNAFSRAMRDAICESLSLALVDDSISELTIEGAGPSFCSGGELAEFGTFVSPVESHVTRMTRSPARLLSQLAEKATVHLHGACFGAGIELPAFARRVTANPDTRICLPELGLGLIPGAGGTVSLPRRIGRHRTALLALSQSVISAQTAVEWGLVDELTASPT